MKRLTVLTFCCMLGISSLVGCGKTQEPAKKPPVVEKEKEVFQDTYEMGVFTTENYVVTLGDSGFAEERKFVLEYTIENKSDKTIKPDEIFGFNLKIGQYDEPIVLSRLSDSLAVLVEDKTDVLHDSIKSCKTASGLLVFDIPEGKEEIDIQVKALDTKTNKSLGEYTLDLGEYTIEGAESSEGKEEEEPQPKKEKEVPKQDRTGADDALDSTEKDITEKE